MAAWSLSARRAWIEITSEVSDRVPLASLSARRAWIEIIKCAICRVKVCVALRKESVDRNTKKSVCYSTVRLVALRKESVNRNADVVPV